MDDSTVVIAGAARTAMGGMNGALSGMAATEGKTCSPSRKPPLTFTA